MLSLNAIVCPLQGQIMFYGNILKLTSKTRDVFSILLICASTNITGHLILSPNPIK